MKQRARSTGYTLDGHNLKYFLCSTCMCVTYDGNTLMIVCIVYRGLCLPDTNCSGRSPRIGETLQCFWSGAALPRHRRSTRISVCRFVSMCVSKTAVDCRSTVRYTIMTAALTFSVCLSKYTSTRWKRLPMDRKRSLYVAEYISHVMLIRV